MLSDLALQQLRESARRNVICLLPPLLGIAMGFLILWWTSAAAKGAPPFDPEEIGSFLKPSIGGIEGVVAMTPLWGIFAFSVLLLNLMSVIVLAISITSILHSFEVKTIRRAWLVIAAIAIPFVVYIAIVQMVPNLRHAFVGRNLAISDYFNAILEERTHLAWIDEMFSVEKSVLVLSCCMAGVALGALLFDGSSNSTASMVVLRKRMLWARIILYSLGVYTLVGIFQIRVGAQLPSIWMDEKGSELVTQIATGMTAFVGITGSLVLSAIYLPAYLILQRRAIVLAETLHPDASVKQRDEWLVENGLTTSPLKASMSTLAALAPFLASGPLRSLIGGLLEFRN